MQLESLIFLAQGGGHRFFHITFSVGAVLSLCKSFMTSSRACTFSQHVKYIDCKVERVLQTDISLRIAHWHGCGTN